MANVFRQATSWLYTLIAATFLGSWALFILCLVGLTAVNKAPSLVELIAMPSLLTFLAAKCIVTFAPVASPAPGPGRAPPPRDLATWIATVDDGSPQGALALFLLSLSWLLHLVRVAMALFLLVIMGGFFLFASSLSAADQKEKSAGGSGFIEDTAERDNLTTALMEIEQEIGITFGDYIKGNPWLLFQVVTGLWAVSATLVVYILAYSLSALRQVLTTPLEAWARGDAAPDVPRPAVAAAVEKDGVAPAVVGAAK
ncbi:hypothetical protein CPLU01_07214 [Colletotrichum plurivorum]|uniref:Uncharacterized protein n=1 Tax=Colletotrichum plurivorum TaxID=2175906 RepID=A0A8H6KGF9_9PEZI|nr:hypothetical protein CPLU01_07214 [Colletotrichum plurivorum]